MATPFDGQRFCMAGRAANLQLSAAFWHAEAVACLAAGDHHGARRFQALARDDSREARHALLIALGTRLVPDESLSLNV